MIGELVTAVPSLLPTQINQSLYMVLGLDAERHVRSWSAAGIPFRSKSMNLIYRISDSFKTIEQSVSNKILSAVVAQVRQVLLPLNHSRQCMGTSSPFPSNEEN